MSEPFHHLPPSEREAWVEAQVWRRCMASRRGAAGTHGAPGGTDEAQGMSLQALVARSSELGAASAGEQEPVEVERLLEVARQVELLSSLPPRRAPAALDAVLGLLESCVSSPLGEGDEVSGDGMGSGEEADPEALPLSPEELAAFEREDGRLTEWMRSLPSPAAPAELDVRFEAELARHVRALPRPAAVAPAGTGPALRRLPEGPFSDSGARDRSGMRLTWNRRWIAVAAAALLFGAIGVGILLRGLRFGGAGAADDPGTTSRFSFHYVDVETAGADVAQRPALRLLRGWASHIAPEELERSSSGK